LVKVSRGIYVREDSPLRNLDISNLAAVPPDQRFQTLIFFAYVFDLREHVAPEEDRVASPPSIAYNCNPGFAFGKAVDQRVDRSRIPERHVCREEHGGLGRTADGGNSRPDRR